MNSSVPLCALCGEGFCLCRFGVGAFCGFTQRHKTRGVVRRNVSQDLAVQLHAGLLEAADELVIADALGARCRANADDPDGAVLALLLLAAGVGKLEAALYGLLLLRDRVLILLENIRWRAQVSFCGAGGV